VGRVASRPVGMDPDAAEVIAEPRLEEGPLGRRQGRAAPFEAVEAGVQGRAVVRWPGLGGGGPTLDPVA
jgi:hypothetical protein